MKQGISLQSVLVGRFRLLVAVLGLVVFAGCNDQTTPLETEGPLLQHKDTHGGGGGPPGGGGSGGPQLEPAIIVTIFDDAGNGIRSDGRGVYEHGKCGVHATFNLKDVRLVPANQVIKKRDEDACGGTREDRHIAVTLGGTIYQGTFMNVDQVEDVTTLELKTLFIGGLGGLCSPGLWFDPSFRTGSTLVEVVKNNGSWTVRSQAGGSRAVCVQDGVDFFYDLTFEMKVELQ